MSRLLWLSNPPWAPSGYGEQTALFAPRLQAQGHDVAVLANWALQGRAIAWNGIVCYPADGLWGNRNLAVFTEQHEADQVIALCDAWVLKPDAWPEELTVAVWAPVDRWPIPPAVLAVLDHERITPIAMSRFAYELMEQFKLDPIYVPHGVDTQLFKPLPADRAGVREELDLPADAFVVGMVAANVGDPSVPRKAFPQAFMAFKHLLSQHDDAYLYVHADPVPPAGTGINLDTLAAVLGIPEGRIRFPHPNVFQIGVPTQAIAYIYQAFDVLLSPSMGEGFGIPILEAQACGVPVIASDHSAMTELAGNGWLVSGDPWWDSLQESFLIVPHVRSIADALEHAYQAREDQDLRRRAVEFAGDYDADLVADTYWRPALERLLTPAAPPTVALERRVAAGASR